MDITVIAPYLEALAACGFRGCVEIHFSGRGVGSIRAIQVFTEEDPQFAVDAQDVLRPGRAGAREETIGAAAPVARPG